MGLTRTQIEYAFRRIDGHLREAVLAVSEKHTKPAKALSPAERADLIRKGKVKLRAGVEVWPHTDVLQVFDFKAFEWSERVDKAAVAKAVAPLEAQAQSIKDRLVLGDQEQALAAIEEFAAACSRRRG